MRCHGGRVPKTGVTPSSSPSTEELSSGTHLDPSKGPPRSPGPSPSTPSMRRMGSPPRMASCGACEWSGRSTSSQGTGVGCGRHRERSPSTRTCWPVTSRPSTTVPRRPSLTMTNGVRCLHSDGRGASSTWTSPLLPHAEHLFLPTRDDRIIGMGGRHVAEAMNAARTWSGWRSRLSRGRSMARSTADGAGSGTRAVLSSWPCTARTRWPRASPSAWTFEPVASTTRRPGSGDESVVRCDGAASRARRSDARSARVPRHETRFRSHRLAHGSRRCAVVP